MSKSFFQTGPQLNENTYVGDPVLRSILKRKLPDSAFTKVDSDLTRFGVRMATDVAAMARAAEAQKPKHVPFDSWGHRIDRIDVSSAWLALDRVSAEEGIVAEGYERRYGEFSRLAQFAKLSLFHPSSAFYSCPLAMTDGAARAIELHGDEALKRRAFSRLTSRDPEKFWTSGQWMTEREGGSDVGRSSTLARLENGTYRLYGDKWFTSATTSQMAMTLARIEGAPEGSKGLSLFYLELRDDAGNLQNIRVNRLKDKLGTDALPTAELTLEGTPAILVGGEGGGVRKIATLFNITRLYNACCAVGSMKRALDLAQDYSRKRVAFGRVIAEHPLHQETLADLAMEFEAGLHLTMFAAELLGREECGRATEMESATLRGLMPIVKLFTGKQAVAVASEALELIGGAGYIEDTGLPRLLRDAQVFSIWEGTTNVLSLDLLRAIEKERAFEGISATMHELLGKIHHSELRPEVHAVSKSWGKIEAVKTEELQRGARRYALSIARTFAAALLLDHAEWALESGVESGAAFAETARRWCQTHLVLL